MAHAYPYLDRHFHLPQIRTVESTRPLVWLKQGWRDLLDNLPASLAYGACFAVIGYLILAYVSDMPYLYTAAICGFFLIGPVAAAGLYEISRRHDQGERTGLMSSLHGLARNTESLFYFGLFLALALVSWERLSAILFALFYRDNIADLGQFYGTVFFSLDYLPFVITYLIVGGALAALVYTLSAVSVPMLMDRDTDIATAMMTSARAVGTNLPAMARWAGLIVALCAIGFATMMLGMIVLLPLLGHASWHAYKDLVE